MSDVDQEPRLTKWITIPLGLLLLPLALVSIVASILFFLSPDNSLSFSRFTIGSLLLTTSTFALILSYRMILNQPSRKDAGLLPPWLLYAAGALFAIFPLASIAFGTFWDNPLRNSVMTIAYIFIVPWCFRLANSRRRHRLRD